jgi:hypothetical protein
MLYRFYAFILGLKSNEGATAKLFEKLQWAAFVFGSFRLVIRIS